MYDRFPFYDRLNIGIHWKSPVASAEVRRKYWYRGKRRQFWHWGYDWYHYLLQDAHDRRPKR